MKSFIVAFALIACASASGLLAPAYGHAYAPAGIAYAPAIGYAKTYIPTTVPAGVSLHAYSVPQSRFTSTEWEKPGDTIIERRVHRYPVEVAPAHTTLHAQPPIHTAHTKVDYVPTLVKTSVPVHASAPIVANVPIAAKVAAYPALHAPAFHAPAFHGYY